MNQLVVVTYPAGNIQAAKNFYETLLGIDLAVSLSEKIHSLHTYVATGVKFEINQRQANQEHAIAHFQVNNLDQAINALSEKGGKKIAGPFDIPIADAAMERLKQIVKNAGVQDPVEKSMGQGAIVADPDGNFVGIVQLAPFAQAAFKRGQLTSEDLSDQREAVEAGKLITW
jgi:predicted enzyme related to lactoylglutathione lyase